MFISVDLLQSLGAIHRHVPKEQIVFYEGDEVNFYYQVVQGKVKMTNTIEDGREFIHDIYLPGQPLGLHSLFAGNHYKASAIAIEETQLIRLNKDIFLHLLKEFPAINLSSSYLLSEHIQFKSILLKELSFYRPEHRIITLISHFRSLSTFPDAPMFKVNLTRQQIADMTGLRVETVIKAIRKLNDKGNVILKKGKVYVV